MGSGRGGSGTNRGARGNQMGAGRGMVQNRGRGGMHGSGRGGNLGPSGGSMRGGHHNRDGFRNQRGGGSYANGPRHHQNNASFRGRGGSQSHGPGRNARSDGHHGRSQVAGSSSANNLGKRDENRRTLTDFKIVGLELPALGWQWGQVVVPDSEVKKEDDDDKLEVTEGKENAGSPTKVDDAETEKEIRTSVSSGVDKLSAVKDSTESRSAPSGASAPRMRIYFHTPPSADDARLITSTSAQSDSRKGKRKKVDDDEDTEDEHRAPPPPPGPGRDESVDAESTLAPSATMDFDASTGRGSAAPSDDFLVQALRDGDADGEGESVTDNMQFDHDMDIPEHAGKLIFALHRGWAPVDALTRTKIYIRPSASLVTDSLYLFFFELKVITRHRTRTRLELFNQTILLLMNSL